MHALPNQPVDAIQIAERVFAHLAARFPHLRMIRHEDAPVEISINISKQPGLTENVWLCLQNKDELHFGVGHFWLEWFPCTDPSVEVAYIEAVAGFISGKYRILEHYRGKRCIKAQLQVPQGGSWKAIGTTYLWGLPFPFRKSTREIRND